jgi:hypothetical protein
MTVGDFDGSLDCCLERMIKLQTEHAIFSLWMHRHSRKDLAFAPGVDIHEVEMQLKKT